MINNHNYTQTTKVLALTIAAVFIIGAITIPLTTEQVLAAQKKATLNVIIQGGKEGKQGPKGDKGDPGSPGAPGVPGEKGETGATGAQGDAGAAGEAGAAGDPGPRGETGETGAAGPQGEKGDPGTVTINLCQANQEGCQAIEAEAGDNVTIAVNITSPEENQTTEPEPTPPVDNGSVIVQPPENGSVIVVPPTDNNTVVTPPTNGSVIVEPPGNTTSSGNESTTAPPVQCQPNTHEENGVCVDDTGFPPSNGGNNETTSGNITGGNLTQ